MRKLTPLYDSRGWVAPLLIICYDSDMLQKVTRWFRDAPQQLSIGDWAMLGGGLAVFSVITLGNITRWSIWFDEAFGIYLIRFSYPEVAQYTATDVHPPLYYWLFKAWQSLFGSSELALRSLSLVGILVAIGLVFGLVRRRFGRLAAGLGLGMMAILPLMIRYGEEARMYGLAMAIVAAATVLLVRLTEKPSTKGYAAYGLLLALGMWTHYFTAVMWLAHWVWRWWLVRAGSAKRTAKAFWTKQWIMAHVVAMAAYAPWLAIMIKQVTSLQGGGFWIGPVSADTPFNFLTNMVLYRQNGEATGWLGLGMLVLLVLGTLVVVRALRTLSGVKKQQYMLLVIMSLAPMAWLLLLSMPPLRSVFIERYLLPSMPFWAATLGVALSLAWQRSRPPISRRLAWMVIGLYGVLSLSGIVHLYQIGNFNKNANDPLLIRPLIQQLQAASPDGQPIVARSSWRFYEAHYYQTPTHQVYFEATDDLTWGSYDMLRHNAYHKLYDTAAFARQHGGRIWYVGDWEQGKPELPRQGSWRVIREMQPAKLPADRSGFRAVEVELLP